MYQNHQQPYFNPTMYEHHTQQQGLYPKIGSNDGPPPPGYNQDHRPLLRPAPNCGVQPHIYDHDTDSNNDTEREIVARAKKFANREMLKMYCALVCQVLIILTVFYLTAIYEPSRYFLLELYTKIGKWYLLSLAVAFVLLLAILFVKRPWEVIILPLFDIIVGFLFGVHFDSAILDKIYLKLIIIGALATFCLTNTLWAFRNRGD